MFPLGTVLLPGAVLPLHVFETRYRRLVKDLLEGEPEFGVALIEKGSEVGGGDQRSTVGTVARLVQVAEMPDGRYALVSVGTRRIRVTGWLADDPYPKAEVEDWPDEVEERPDEPGEEPPEVRPVGPDALAEQLSAAHRHVRRVAALAVELGDRSTDPAPEISPDPVSASYQLCALAPLGPADRHRLLGAPGPVARLALLHELLDDVEAMLRFRLLDAGGTDAGEPGSGSGGES